MSTTFNAEWLMRQNFPSTKYVVPGITLSVNLG
jgi:hypothetical protein